MLRVWREACLVDLRKVFRCWHETDMPTTLRDVRFPGQSRKHMLAGSFSGFDLQKSGSFHAVIDRQDSPRYGLSQATIEFKGKEMIGRLDPLPLLAHLRHTDGH